MVYISAASTEPGTGLRGIGGRDWGATAALHEGRPANLKALRCSMQVF